MYRYRYQSSVSVPIPMSVTGVSMDSDKRNRYRTDTDSSKRCLTDTSIGYRVSIPGLTTTLKIRADTMALTPLVYACNATCNDLLASGIS